MGETEINREIDALSTLISSLEEQAGVTHAAALARQAGSPDKLRDAYYSVTNSNLRQQLIATTGKLDQLYLQKCEQDVSVARAEVFKAVEKSQTTSKHMLLASLAGTAVIGYWAFGLIGAMTGSLIGYFLGEWAIAAIKKDDAKTIELAKGLLVAALKRNEESKLDPYLFSLAEQQGCERER